MSNDFPYIELVPQVVIDAGNNLKNANNFNVDMHRHRLEVIRDYCQRVLQETDHNNSFAKRVADNKKSR